MIQALEVKNLTKQFNGLKAVDDISFSANEGEILGLLGPNGAGKTTTIRVIATILSPTAGTARVYGFDIVKDPEEVRKNLGVLTAEIGVYERFTGREILEYFGELYGISGEESKIRINKLVNLLEMGEFINKATGKYSTGMKQKLAIARSIIHDPKVIILDEPTAGLDVLASQTVLDFMKRAKAAGKCVILSTHQMIDVQKLCDRVVIIHHGKIIANDTVKALESKTKTSDLEGAFMRLIGGR